MDLNPNIGPGFSNLLHNLDKRRKELEGRVYNIEGWANSAGHLGTPPAQGVTDESGSFDTLRRRGDA
jgi:hypothetical protein